MMNWVQSIQLASIQTLPRSAIIIAVRIGTDTCLMHSSANLAFHKARSWVNEFHYFLGHAWLTSFIWYVRTRAVFGTTTSCAVPRKSITSPDWASVIGLDKPNHAKPSRTDPMLTPCRERNLIDPQDPKYDTIWNYIKFVLVYNWNSILQRQLCLWGFLEEKDKRTSSKPDTMRWSARAFSSKSNRWCVIWQRLSNQKT